MIGAVVGDIVGSTYEFNNTRDYNFELFPKGSSFTDDTVCTIAVADAILKKISYRDSLINWCKKYPHPKGAYGASFSQWILQDEHLPYGSFGNGAAMRVSPVGWAFNNLEETELQACESAKCSRSHPEGKKGAIAIAKSIFLLRTERYDEAMKFVKNKILIEFYGLDYKKRLPQKGDWNETCQGCVPLACIFFYSLMALKMRSETSSPMVVILIH